MEMHLFSRAGLTSAVSWRALTNEKKDGQLHWIGKIRGHILE